MDAKVDYLSWTIMVDPGRGGDDGETFRAVLAAVQEHAPIFFEWAESTTGWQAGSGRGHYGEAQVNMHLYTAIRYGGHSNHILLEMPGTACAAARDAGMMSGIAAEAQARCTRLDVAVDITGDVQPGDFVAAGYNTRFKSHATIVSAEGTTEYVGSMKSERYARVYRYAEPHPRAGTMRVEHVFRSDYAKSAASALAEVGITALATMCGNTWGWRHRSWIPEAITDGKLTATRADRHEPGRLRWLYGVCLPAVVKAHREGLLDAREYVQELLSAL